MSARRTPTVFDSFNNAAEGIIHVVRTQRNMRIHFAVAFVVIVAALIVNVTKLELIALCMICARGPRCPGPRSSRAAWLPRNPPG